MVNLVNILLYVQFKKKLKIAYKDYVYFLWFVNLHVYKMKFILMKIYQAQDQLSKLKVKFKLRIPNLKVKS